MISGSVVSAIERVLVADRLRRVALVDRVRVDPARPFRERRAVLPEPALHHVPGQGRQVADRADPVVGQDDRGLLADPPEPSDRQGREEGRLLTGRHDDEAVRLPQVRGDLRDELVGRHPDRGRQPDVGAAPPP